MTRSIKKYLAWIAVSAGFVAPCSLAQGSSSGSSTQSADGGAGTSPRQATAPAPPAETKKPKKVWTNEDFGTTGEQLSSAKNAKGLPQTSSGAPDAQYIANTKKQLEKLQGQLRDTEQQLSDLRDLQSGKQPTTSGGYQLNKGYNRVPVDQQITNLENKKKDLQTKIGDLLDEARKKGVEPGQLR